MSTPVIFLDFDGVLNCGTDPGTGLNPVMVARLNRICEATGAHVVVTSAWRRIYRERCQLADILVAAGFTGMVAGMTPTDVAGGRMAEIQAWQDAPPPRRYRGAPFCIIDDEHDFWGWERYLVRTHPIDGLTDGDADKAIQLLGVR